MSAGMNNIFIYFKKAECTFFFYNLKFTTNKQLKLKIKNFMALSQGGIQLPQGQSHFEEAVYFLQQSSQKFLVLILSTSVGSIKTLKIKFNMTQQRTEDILLTQKLHMLKLATSQSSKQFETTIACSAKTKLSFNLNERKY